VLSVDIYQLVELASANFVARAVLAKVQKCQRRLLAVGHQILPLVDAFGSVLYPECHGTALT
jgi:hypothetical protein